MYRSCKGRVHNHQIQLLPPCCICGFKIIKQKLNTTYSFLNSVSVNPARFTVALVYILVSFKAFICSGYLHNYFTCLTAVIWYPNRLQWYGITPALSLLVQTISRMPTYGILAVDFILFLALFLFLASSGFHLLLSNHSQTKQRPYISLIQFFTIARPLT